MGLGISIVTAICLTEADRERLAARSLARWFPRRSYGVVMRKGKYLSPQARAFVDLIKPDLFTREHDASGHSRSEEHTSELQSLMRISYAGFCMKNKKRT